MVLASALWRTVSYSSRNASASSLVRWAVYRRRPVSPLPRAGFCTASTAADMPRAGISRKITEAAKHSYRAGRLLSRFQLQNTLSVLAAAKLSTNRSLPCRLMVPEIRPANP